MGRALVVLGVVLVSLASATAAWAAVDVRQMTDDTIVNGNTVSCEQNAVGNYTLEESYYRRFHLPDYGVTGPFAVTSATFGVDIANDGADAGQPLTVRLHTVPAGSPLLLANLTQVDFDDLTIADAEAGQAKSADLNGTIAHPNTTDLVLELHIPDGVSAHNRLVIGSNQAAETKPGYWRASACSYFEPTKFTDPALNFPNVHVILFATGDEGPDVDAPNLGVKIPGGQTVASAFDKGVRARLSSGEPCDLDVSLLISRKLAHNLGIPRVIGRAHRVLAKAGERSVTTDLTRRAKHALKGRHSLSLIVRSKATDDADNAKTVSKSVTL